MKDLSSFFSFLLSPYYVLSAPAPRSIYLATSSAANSAAHTLPIELTMLHGFGPAMMPPSSGALGKANEGFGRGGGAIFSDGGVDGTRWRPLPPTALIEQHCAPDEECQNHYTSYCTPSYRPNFGFR